MSVEKALVIKGPLRDLGDVLAIARVEGKKVLGANRVRVKPYLALCGDNDYVVVVEPEEAGCSKVSVVETGKQPMHGT